MTDTPAPFHRTHPATRRRRQAGEARRRAMRDAALSLFSLYGLYGTSLDQVAERAGASKTNLLYHYPSKEALYLAVLEETLDIWRAPFEALSETLEPSEALRRYIRLKLEISRDHAEASRLYGFEIMQGAPLLNEALTEGLRHLFEEKTRLIRAWVRDGRLASVDPNHLFYLLWASTQHYADFAPQIEALSGRTLHDPAFMEEAVESVQTIVIAGLAPRQAGVTPPQPFFGRRCRPIPRRKAARSNRVRRLSAQDPERRRYAASSLERRPRIRRSDV